MFGSDSPVQLALRRETTTANGGWFELPVAEAGRYLQVRMIKTGTHDLAGHLFADEVEVLDAAGTNIARSALPQVPSGPTGPGVPRHRRSGADRHRRGRRFRRRARLRLPDALARGDADRGPAGPRRGADAPNGPAASVREPGPDYDPDLVRVWTGDSPVSLTLAGETWTPSNGWYELGLPATIARYLKVEAVKPRTSNFSDYMFLDELAATS